jgi:hypothetical protein
MFWGKLTSKQELIGHVYASLVEADVNAGRRDPLTAVEYHIRAAAAVTRHERDLTIALVAR